VYTETEVYTLTLEYMQSYTKVYTG